MRTEIKSSHLQVRSLDDRRCYNRQGKTWETRHVDDMSRPSPTVRFSAWKQDANRTEEGSLKKSDGSETFLSSHKITS